MKHAPTRESIAGYNPDIIVLYAKKLYRRCRAIEAFWTVAGVLLGIMAGGLVGSSYDYPERGWFMIAFAVIMGTLGYAQGTARTFLMKLQAQQALCQLQIEVNTRGLFSNQSAPSPGEPRPASPGLHEPPGPR